MRVCGSSRAGLYIRAHVEGQDLARAYEHRRQHGRAVQAGATVRFPNGAPTAKRAGPCSAHVRVRRDTVSRSTLRRILSRTRRCVRSVRASPEDIHAAAILATATMQIACRPPEAHAHSSVLDTAADAVAPTLSDRAGELANGLAAGDLRREVTACIVHSQAALKCSPLERVRSCTADGGLGCFGGAVAVHEVALQRLSAAFRLSTRWTAL